MIVAAIDCGTNSIRLLVTRRHADGRFEELDRRMEVVRLGEGVDRTGVLSEAALRRTFSAAERYGQIIRDLGATRVRFVATSASRDAGNREVFVEGVRRILGVDPEVISGDEEARLSFRGATDSLRSAHPSPYLVVDIGGGSTEFVLGDHQPEAARSVDIGCVRMTERHLADDPPTAEAIAAARDDIDAAIELAAGTVPLRQAATLIGVAGSVTTVAALALELPEYDRNRIHGSVISSEQVRAVSDHLLTLTRAERAALPVMHPGRVDVIGAGALVLRRIVDRVGVAQVVVSEHDILDGTAAALAEQGDV